jgi:hypothetical protein
MAQPKIIYIARKLSNSERTKAHKFVTEDGRLEFLMKHTKPEEVYDVYNISESLATKDIGVWRDCQLCPPTNIVDMHKNEKTNTMTEGDK